MKVWITYTMVLSSAFAVAQFIAVPAIAEKPTAIIAMVDVDEHNPDGVCEAIPQHGPTEIDPAPTKGCEEKSLSVMHYGFGLGNQQDCENACLDVEDDLHCGCESYLGGYYCRWNQVWGFYAMRVCCADTGFPNTEDCEDETHRCDFIDDACRCFFTEG